MVGAAARLHQVVGRTVQGLVGTGAVAPQVAQALPRAQPYGVDHDLGPHLLVTVDDQVVQQRPEPLRVVQHLRAEAAREVSQGCLELGGHAFSRGGSVGRVVGARGCRLRDARCHADDCGA